MSVIIGLILGSLCAICTAEPSPQYFPQHYPRQQHFQSQPPPSYSNPWQASFRSNISNPLPNPIPPPASYYPNPGFQGYPDPLYGGNIPEQQYGLPLPSPSNTGYPQIYKIDNLVIIANPPQQQPCIPQPRPPAPFPNVRPPTDGEGGLQDRMPGDGEPSKCTWAIVACCSPNTQQVRYYCFELLGCPGFFFDNSACEPKIVMAAANAALEYYRSSGNTTSAGSSDTVSNNV